jgi:hypothetical protein
MPENGFKPCLLYSSPADNSLPQLQIDTYKSTKKPSAMTNQYYKSQKNRRQNYSSADTRGREDAAYQARVSSVVS